MVERPTPDVSKEVMQYNKEVAEEKQRKLQKKKDMTAKVTSDWNLFCQSPSLKAYNHTFESIQKLQNEFDVKDEEVPILKVNTTQLFEKGFKFDSVSKYEFSQEQLNTIEAAEKNFNNNLDNEKVRDAFIQTATEVAKNLKEKYGEQWVQPGQQMNSEVALD